MLGAHALSVSLPPRFRHTCYLCFLAASATGLMAIGGMSCTPTTPAAGSGDDDRGMAMAEANQARLSAFTAKPVDALPGSAGPPGSVAGITLDDGNRAFILGSITNDVLAVTGVVLQDQNGGFIMQQNLYGNGTAMIFATGDQAEVLDNGDGTAQLKLTLNATTPATVLYAALDPQSSEVTFNEAWAKVYNTPNAAYENQSTTARLILPSPDTSIWDTPPGATLPWPVCYDISTQKTRRQAAKPTCASLGNSLVSAANIACDVKSMVTSHLPTVIVNAICIGALRTFEHLKDPEAPQTVRVTAFVKWSVSVLCEGLKAGAGVASVFTKFNPIDLACFVLSYVDETVQVQTGEKLADKLCALLGGTSDQGDQGEEDCPVGQFRASNGQCVGCPEDSGGCPANQYLGQDGLCHDMPAPCLLTTSTGCKPDHGSDTLRILDVSISQYVDPPYGDAVEITYNSGPVSRLDVIFEPCSLPGVNCSPSCPETYRFAMSISPGDFNHSINFDYNTCGTGRGDAVYQATIINPATGETASMSTGGGCQE